MIRRDLLVRETGHIGQARMLAVHGARVAGLAEPVIAKVALAATELATNLLRHAGEGAILVENGVRGLEVVAVDQGPGLALDADGVRDGYSTHGGLGLGLGAVQRAADEFDLFTVPDAGTVVLARWSAGASGPPVVGAVRSAAPGESVCGDAWLAMASGTVLTAVVCDGLGHGVLAAAASQRAMELADTHSDADPGSLLGLVSDGLAGTRGAAVAVARVDPERGEVRFAGIGNVTAALYGPDELSARALISTPGICGVAAGRSRPQVSTHPWTAGSVLVMHSDGVHSRWSLKDWPAARDHDPTALAAWVLWQANRRRDDACVLVVSGGPR